MNPTINVKQSTTHLPNNSSAFNNTSNGSITKRLTMSSLISKKPENEQNYNSEALASKILFIYY